MLLKISSFCTTHKSSVSTGFTEQIMPILRILCYNGSLFTWTVVSLTIAKFKSVWLHLFLYREHVHSHDFVWLQLVACTILLYSYNRILTEGWKPCANRGSTCTLNNFQWCAEVYFSYPPISQSLHSNGCTCYTAPSLRFFVPNGLQAYRHFFFSEGCVCDVCDRSHLPPRGSVFTAITLQLLPL
jgi:hypothetical protein